jgi:hypothetical protein
MPCQTLGSTMIPNHPSSQPGSASSGAKPTLHGAKKNDAKEWVGIVQHGLRQGVYVMKQQFNFLASVKLLNFFSTK